MREVGSRIFLANVGANASHPFKSPIFDDGTFELLPIPEDRKYYGPRLVRYGDLTSFNRPEESLRAWIPERRWNRPCHADPEFHTYTYGDDCDVAPRAVGLKMMQPGDTLFFIARLVAWHAGKFLDQPGLYLIGFLEVEQVLAGVRSRPEEKEMSVFGNNAHVRRATADPALWNSFWVFKGSPNSWRFKKAVPVTRELASQIFCTAGGEPWRWDRHRSELQTIGSYTRTCRRIIDPASPGSSHRAQLLWSTVAAVESNGG